VTDPFGDDTLHVSAARAALAASARTTAIVPILMSCMAGSNDLLNPWNPSNLFHQLNLLNRWNRWTR
jgi:hypothetical protein